MTWIQTYTGRAFDLVDPQPDMVHPEDLAHALSRLCRFTGHVKRFYSVAEHSIYVSELVPDEHSLWGLLHDGAEAYIGDVSAPLKALLPDYRAVEKRVEAAVFAAFGLEGEVPEEVKAVDRRMLVTEAGQLLGETPKDWGVDAEPYLYMDNIGHMTPTWAKELFSERLAVLTAARGAVIA